MTDWHVLLLRVFNDSVCPDAEGCIGGLLAGPTDEKELGQYQAHLDACVSCEREWHALQPIAELLRHVFADDV
jgi:hypothetical protein